MSLFRYGFALIASVMIVPAIDAGEFQFQFPRNVAPQGGCNNPDYRVCKSKWSGYKPPSVHPNTTFGYYPTQWARWPGTYANQAPSAPPVAPNKPNVPDSQADPLPMPRPYDRRPETTGDGPRLPAIQPARHPLFQ